MIVLILKKTMYECWDNMFRVIVMNSLFILTLFFIYQVYGYLPGLGLLLPLCLMMSLLITSVTVFFIHQQSLSTIENLKLVIMKSLVCLSVYGIGFFSIFFYLGRDGFVSLLFLFVCLWVLVFFAAGSQFALICAYYGNIGYLPALKFSFFLFFRHFFLSLTLFLITLVMLFLSPLLVFGFVPAQILIQNSGLLLLKYYHLSGQGTENKSVRDKFLNHERMQLKTRSFKKLVFPWR